jgi:parallel beta-helix repeat protein
MNRVVLASLTILCLLFVSSIAGLIQIVKAYETIYINADGSISPSTAPIFSTDKITYTLTGNITADADGIVIERDNIVLDGAGYTVQGPWVSFSVGIDLTGRSNVTVNNITVRNFSYGIWLDSSSNITLSGNNVTRNSDSGIQLDSSSDNVLSGNNVTANYWEGITLYRSSDNILSGNNITTNKAYGIWLKYSSNITLSGNNVTGINGYGILLESSSNSTLSGNNVTGNNEGIELDSSSNNFIFLNNFVNNTNQAYTDGLANNWHFGSMGNYWSDYLTKYPNATETDGLGVWNTPYVIDANNTDHYPLTVPYAIIPEFPSLLILPLFIVATVLAIIALLAVIIYKKKGVKTSQS